MTISVLQHMFGSRTVLIRKNPSGDDDPAPGSLLRQGYGSHTVLIPKAEPWLVIVPRKDRRRG